jgi:hypothetical protein
MHYPVPKRPIESQLATAPSSLNAIHKNKIDFFIASLSFQLPC